MAELSPQSNREPAIEGMGPEIPGRTLADEGEGGDVRVQVSVNPEGIALLAIHLDDVGGLLGVEVPAGALIKRLIDAMCEVPDA